MLLAVSHAWLVAICKYKVPSDKKATFLDVKVQQLLDEMINQLLVCCFRVAELAKKHKLDPVLPVLEAVLKESSTPIPCSPFSDLLEGP